jgi:3'(2'), 5'-bisphosphate nucleotidase
MNPSIADARRVEKILRNCGALLLKSLSTFRSEGKWIGTQFKAPADNLAHDFLVNSLGEAFPGIPVVSEEDTQSIFDGTTNHFIIDPIDGTASFAHGFSGWVTQAAYISEGRPVMAGIYAPVSDEYFSAISQQGAYYNGHPLTIVAPRNDPSYLIDNYPKPCGIALELMRELQIPKYLESGSIALKICRVADGSADIFIKNMVPRDWDVAAPMLLLAEAGGILTDINGAALTLGSPERSHSGIIASASPLVTERVRAWFASRK